MIKSLEISKLLFALLKSQTECVDRLYPLVAENGTEYPFIVYSRDNVTNNECKDGIYEDIVSFTVNIVSSTYHQSISIAQTVRDILCKRKIVSNDIIMRDVSIVSASERFEDDAYVQTLQFTAKITNN